VVASQSLEIQHLQEQLNRKDRESHAALSRVLEEKANVESQLATQQARSARLEAQVQLLGDRLREMEGAEGRVLANDSAALADASKSARQRDELIGNMRDELRSLRMQTTSLLQERDLLLERYDDERRRREHVENAVAAPTGTAPPRGPRSTSSSTQTVDARSFATVDDVLMAFTMAEGCTESEIESLKAAVQVEVQLEGYHRGVAAQHAANAAVIAEALQRKVETEVSRLAAEQARYRSMLGHGTSWVPAFTPVHAANMTANQRVINSPAAPSTAPDVSPLTVASVAPRQHLQPPAGSFVTQQQEELATLRARLADLQCRHDEVRGVKYQVTTPPASAYHLRRTPSPDVHAAQAYSAALATPTPLDSRAPPSVLTRSAAARAADGGSTVLDRMLRRVHS
jgi:hypothetical protein